MLQSWHFLFRDHLLTFLSLFLTQFLFTYLSFYLSFSLFLFLSIFFCFFFQLHYIHMLSLYLLTFLHPPFHLSPLLSVGMGGSSVLAAAVLSAISTLLGSKLDKERLIHLVSQVEQGICNGSDSDSLLICYL